MKYSSFLHFLGARISYGADGIGNGSIIGVMSHGLLMARLAYRYLEQSRIDESCPELGKPIEASSAAQSVIPSIEQGENDSKRRFIGKRRLSRRSTEAYYTFTTFITEFSPYAATRYMLCQDIVWRLIPVRRFSPPFDYCLNFYGALIRQKRDRLTDIHSQRVFKQQSCYLCAQGTNQQLK